MRSVFAGLARRFETTDPDPTALGRRAIGMLVCGVMLAVSIYFLLHAIPEMVAHWAIYPYDGYIDWGGAREMWEGRDPYSLAGLRAIGLTKERGLGHPPTTLIWFYPLVKLDLMLMKHVFTIITLIMLLYHAGIVTKELRIPMWPFVTLLMFSAVYQADWFILHLSQVDLSELIAFLYVLCWLYLRRGRDQMAGVMAGLACTLKLYPGLLVLFLIASRRWRAVLAAGITYLLFVAEATRRLGLGCFKNFFDQTRSYSDAWISNIRNASIDGIVHRWFYPVWQRAPHGRPTLPAAVFITVVISAVIFALAWMVSARRIRQAHRYPRRIDLPFALFSILTMAPGPYQWEHYNVTLMLPFLVIVADTLEGERNRDWWVRAAVVSALLVAVALLLDVSLAGRCKFWELLPTTPAVIRSALFYDASTWLPWFVLAVILGVRLFQENRRESRDRVARYVTD